MKEAYCVMFFVRPFEAFVVGRLCLCTFVACEDKGGGEHDEKWKKCGRQDMRRGMALR